jgi:hypothetical protein
MWAMGWRVDPSWYEAYWLRGRRPRARWGRLLTMMWFGFWGVLLAGLLSGAR